MMKNYFIVSIIILFLSNCSSLNHSKKSVKEYQQPKDYSQAVAKITEWEVQGKIALLQKDKRESANLYWKNNETSQQQTLNLTTYLGINVLKLSSQREKHTLEVNGEKHQTRDINQMILQLTGYQLPTEALSFWLKGSAFSANDTVEVDSTSFLPKRISSFYAGAHWTIDYIKYTPFSGYQLPTQIVLKQKDFTLKIIIHQWTF